METDRLATRTEAVQRYQCNCHSNGVVCACLLSKIDLYVCARQTLCAASVYEGRLLQICRWWQPLDCVCSSTLLALSDPGLSSHTSALYLLIYLFTVQVKELSTQVCHCTQGIWSYINPQSNEAEMAANLLPLSLSVLPQVIPLIKDGLVWSACVCVRRLVLVLGWGSQGEARNQGEAGSV